MATSAFKSSTKRATSTATPPPSKLPTNTRKAPPPRRSRSVSAVPRGTSQLDVSLEFQNSRENPLFWADGGGSGLSAAASGNSNNNNKLSKYNVERERGRAVSRGYTTGRKETGRSLSRVDTGRRRRSPSRGHFGDFERGKEREIGMSSDTRSKTRSSLNGHLSSSQVEKKKLVRSASDLSQVLKSWDAWSSPHSTCIARGDSLMNVSGSKMSHWDDGGSPYSTSEAEEKTIRPVTEVKKTSHLERVADKNGSTPENVCIEVKREISDIQRDLQSVPLRNNSATKISTVILDIPPDLQEFDIRGEYARELKECEERARALRAELAVEEHREVELNNILNDIIQEPKTPQVQKPRPVRKASMERRKMSRCLEVDAMAYFDECVSISTFDDSDFSSLEDPPSNNPAGGVNESVPGATRRHSAPYPRGNQDHTRQDCNESLCGSDLNSSKTNPRFSFTPTQSRATSLELDIRNYVKSFSRESRKENTHSRMASTGPVNIEECASRLPVEELLMDRMTFKNRIESGAMLLCNGGSGSVSPFSSILW